LKIRGDLRFRTFWPDLPNLARAHKMAQRLPRASITVDTLPD